MDQDLAGREQHGGGLADAALRPEDMTGAADLQIGVMVRMRAQARARPAERVCRMATALARGGRAR
jgi:hypothetical protein